jgi:hypothetical protein
MSVVQRNASPRRKDTPDETQTDSCLCLLCALVTTVSACGQGPQVPVDPYATPGPANTAGPRNAPVVPLPAYTPVPRTGYLDRVHLPLVSKGW